MDKEIKCMLIIKHIKILYKGRVNCGGGLIINGSRKGIVFSQIEAAASIFA